VQKFLAVELGATHPADIMLQRTQNHKTISRVLNDAGRAPRAFPARQGCPKSRENEKKLAPTPPGAVAEPPLQERAGLTKFCSVWPNLGIP
jgi:hypothetical protein